MSPLCPPIPSVASVLPMTGAERASLMVLLRQRERVAKADVDEHKVRLLSDFARQLAAIYRPEDDPVWAELKQASYAAVAEANAKIAARADQLGIIPSFRPSIQADWYGRGENAAAERRADLLRVARTELDAEAKRAYAAIAKASVDFQTQLIASGLTSEAARAFLEHMPTPEQLLPPISVARAEELLEDGRRGRHARRGGTP